MHGAATSRLKKLLRARRHALAQGEESTALCVCFCCSIRLPEKPRCRELHRTFCRRVLAAKVMLEMHHTHRTYLTQLSLQLVLALTGGYGVRGIKNITNTETASRRNSPRSVHTNLAPPPRRACLDRRCTHRVVSRFSLVLVCDLCSGTDQQHHSYSSKCRESIRGKENGPKI